MTGKATTINTLEQERARFAYERAEAAKDKDFNKEYKSYAKKIPMLIKTNGLGATFAFVKTKKDAYQQLYKDTSVWLEREPQGIISEELKKGTDLVKAIIALDSSPYWVLTVEVLAFFVWLRRFSDGLIEGDSDL